KMRRFSNAVVVGKMGDGKSTTLKKLLMDNEARGHFIRGFDVTGEFKTLVKSVNGHTISLDGSDGVINPLQIFRTEDNNNPEKNEEISFMQYISKMQTLYIFLSINPYYA